MIATVVVVMLSSVQSLTYTMPKSSSARGVLEKFFGPGYASDFSESSLAEMDPMWWGIGPGGKPIDQRERERVDGELKENFGELLESARRGEIVDEWRSQGSRGALALVILCDQFSRNIHRGTSLAFAMDEKTPEWAASLIDATDLHPIEKSFGLLPLEHSELLENHRICERAFARLEKEAEPYPDHVRKRISLSKNICVEHTDVIEKFGRYPHRNLVLGRQNTLEETEFLGAGAATWGQ